jgi:hypothetical protein
MAATGIARGAACPAVCAARRPCFGAFGAPRALPSAVLGPRAFAPFLRLAPARALLIGTIAGGAASELGHHAIAG